MKGFIDLHTHSTASDGSMSPAELVRHAKEAGLAAIALTDHDTVDGIEEALAEGKRQGIEVIPGIEISVDYKPELHLLGYFFDNNYNNILPLIKRLKKSREERNPKIIIKLNALGYAITLDEVRNEAMGNIVGRPHVAKVMMKKGYVKDIRDAFDRFLGSGKPAYVKKDQLTPVEGVQEIVKAGGVAALAHPIFLYHTNAQLDALLATLTAAGLSGMEANYVENTVQDTGNLLRLCIKHNLVATGGSDFHGSFKPDIRLGSGKGNLKIPYENLEELKKIPRLNEPGGEG